MSKPPRLASVSDPEDLIHVGLDHLDETFLPCRDMRHRWYTQRDYHLVTVAKDNVQPRQGHSTYVERRIACDRCGTVRVEAYIVRERRGWTTLESIGARYDYPDGYLLKGLPRGVHSSADLVRGLLYTRALEESKAKQKPKTSRSSA